MKHTGITPKNASLEAIGLEGVAIAQWNLPPSTLVTECILNGEGKLADTGALAIDTGEFTGRSPKDRFIVGDDKTTSRVDWGDINQSITSEDFGRLLEDAHVVRLAISISSFSTLLPKTTNKPTTSYVNNSA